MFETFIHLVCEKVIENFSFHIQYQNQKLAFIDSQSVKNIQSFLQENLKKIPRPLISKISEYQQMEMLAEQICGVKKCDPSIHLASGKGIRFSGLTKLCFDAAKPAFLASNTIHPFLSYQSEQTHHSAYTISMHSLNKITEPLNTTLKILQEAIVTNDDKQDVQV